MIGARNPIYYRFMFPLKYVRLSHFSTKINIENLTQQVYNEVGLKYFRK